jgi:hypothetical protein
MWLASRPAESLVQSARLADAHPIFVALALRKVHGSRCAGTHATGCLGDRPQIRFDIQFLERLWT